MPVAVIVPVLPPTQVSVEMAETVVQLTIICPFAPLAEFPLASPLPPPPPPGIVPATAVAPVLLPPLPPSPSVPLPPAPPIPPEKLLPFTAPFAEVAELPPPPPPLPTARPPKPPFPPEYLISPVHAAACPPFAIVFCVLLAKPPDATTSAAKLEEAPFVPPFAFEVPPAPPAPTVTE